MTAITVQGGLWYRAFRQRKKKAEELGGEAALARIQQDGDANKTLVRILREIQEEREKERDSLYTERELLQAHIVKLRRTLSSATWYADRLRDIMEQNNIAPPPRPVDDDPDAKS